MGCMTSSRTVFSDWQGGEVINCQHCQPSGSDQPGIHALWLGTAKQLTSPDGVSVFAKQLRGAQSILYRPGGRAESSQLGLVG